MAGKQPLSPPAPAAPEGAGAAEQGIGIASGLRDGELDPQRRAI